MIVWKKKPEWFKTSKERAEELAAPKHEYPVTRRQAPQMDPEEFQAMRLWTSGSVFGGAVATA